MLTIHMHIWTSCTLHLVLVTYVLHIHVHANMHKQTKAGLNLRHLPRRDDICIYGINLAL